MCNRYTCPWRETQAQTDSALSSSSGSRRSGICFDCGWTAKSRWPILPPRCAVRDTLSAMVDFRADASRSSVGDARSPFSDPSSPARIRLENQYRKSMSGAASSSTMRSVQISTSQNLGGYCLFTTLPLGSFECMIKEIIRHKCQTGRTTAGNP
jgi:hypothetical protein